MKVTRDQISSLTVRKVTRGELVIGTNTVRQHVLLTADQKILQWTAGDVAQLRESDFASVIESRPEIIVLGTGWHAAFAPRELTFALARRGIGFETMDTPAACRTFNILLNDGRRVAAVLLVSA
ncbi:MAG: MTH938/NDUFAF3 family protein [Woeseia sp.]